MTTQPYIATAVMPLNGRRQKSNNLLCGLYRSVGWWSGVIANGPGTGPETPSEKALAPTQVE